MRHFLKGLICVAGLCGGQAAMAGQQVWDCSGEGDVWYRVTVDSAKPLRLKMESQGEYVNDSNRKVSRMKGFGGNRGYSLWEVDGFKIATDFATMDFEVDGATWDCRLVAGKLLQNAGSAGAGSAPTGRSLGGNLRSKPSVESRKIGSAPAGTPLVYLELGPLYDGYRWYEVEAGGVRGYVWGGIACSDGLKINGVYQVCN